MSVNAEIIGYHKDIDSARCFDNNTYGIAVLELTNLSNQESKPLAFGADRTMYAVEDS